MSLKTKAGIAAIAVGVLAALPGGASAASPKGLDGHRGQFPGLPSRVASKLKRVERALDRAQERADDGNDAGAASQLKAARRALASAQKAAVTQTTTDDADPTVDEAVAFVEHDVVSAGLDLLDGASGSLTSAALLTVGSALDGRDAVLAAIGTLDEDFQADFVDVAGGIVDDTADEADAVASALDEDDLTGTAKTALTTAQKQLAASGVAALALSDLGDDEDYGDDEDAGDDDPGAAEDAPLLPPRPGADGPRRP